MLYDFHKISSLRESIIVLQPYKAAFYEWNTKYQSTANGHRFHSIFKNRTAMDKT